MSFATHQCFSTPLGAVHYLALTRNMTLASHRAWWMVVGIVATVVQVISVLTNRRRVRLDGYPDHWTPGLFAAFAVGLLWGVTPLFLLPFNHADQSITLAFLACALAGNAVTVGGWKLFTSFHVPVSVVPIIVFVGQATAESMLRALGVVVLGGQHHFDVSLCGVSAASRRVARVAAGRCSAGRNPRGHPRCIPFPTTGSASLRSGPARWR